MIVGSASGCGESGTTAKAWEFSPVSLQYGSGVGSSEYTLFASVSPTDSGDLDGCWEGPIGTGGSRSWILSYFVQIPSDTG